MNILVTVFTKVATIRNSYIRILIAYDIVAMHTTVGFTGLCGAMYDPRPRDHDKKDHPRDTTRREEKKQDHIMHVCGNMTNYSER